MAEDRLFSSSQTVYWPTEFVDLVNMLKGVSASGQQTHHPMYRFNTGAIVLAAFVGLIHKREREVGSGRQEISTDTFDSQKLGDLKLSALVMLVPLLGTRDIDLLRPERESELLRKFERYAAGGLEYLRGAMSLSSDSTGQTVIKAEIAKALGTIEELSLETGVQI